MTTTPTPGPADEGDLLVCVDSNGNKTTCENCVFMFVNLDATDCGTSRCSLGASEVTVSCR
jgi:hypothetical protein